MPVADRTVCSSTIG